MSTETIYESCESANDSLGPCPRPLAGSDGGHWWYIDHDKSEEMDTNNDYSFVPCKCKSCPQTMRLSADAEEYPL